MKFKISYVLIEKLKSNYKIKSGKSIKNKLCIIRIVKNDPKFIKNGVKI